MIQRSTVLYRLKNVREIVYIYIYLSGNKALFLCKLYDFLYNVEKMKAKTTTVFSFYIKAILRNITSGKREQVEILDKTTKTSHIREQKNNFHSYLFLFVSFIHINIGKNADILMIILEKLDKII